MPNYDYKCDSCGHALVEFQSISAEALKTCPSCKQETLQRGIGGGNTLLQFKGSGFYITDYCNNSGSEKPAPKKAGGCGCTGGHSCG